MAKRKKIILWATGIFLAVSLMVFAVVNTVIANSVLSSMADVRVEKNEATLADFNMTGEQIEVVSSDGLRINAYIVPNQESKGNVLILHGMHGMDATSVFDHAKMIFDAGYTPVAVDMRAHGKSDGNSLSFGYNEVYDVLAVLDFLKTDSRFATQPNILYGLSMGGSTALNTAAQSELVDGVIAVSPFSSIQDQVADYMERDGAPALFIKSFQPFVNLVLRSKFDVKPVKESPANAVKTLGDIPVFIIHGDQDSQTNLRQGQELFDNCSSEHKELWVVHGADHLIVEDVLADSSAEYRERITDFLDSNFGH